MTQHKDGIELTDDQEAEAQRIVELARQCSEEELTNMARLIASKKDHELFGETEFQLRDIVHRLGAKVVETAANERRKRGLPRC